MNDFRCKICGGDLEIVDKKNGIVRCKNCLNKYTYDTYFIEEFEKQISDEQKKSETILLEKINNNQNIKISQLNRGTLYYIFLDFLILSYLISGLVFVILNAMNVLSFSPQWVVYIYLIIAITMAYIGLNLIKHRPNGYFSKRFFGLMFATIYLIIIITSILLILYYFSDLSIIK